ncbi:MAG TPA: hypothetical protein VGF75_02960 [Candidatus Saccharimonadales bacterium]
MRRSELVKRLIVAEGRIRELEEDLNRIQDRVNVVEELGDTLAVDYIKRNPADFHP